MFAFSMVVCKLESLKKVFRRLPPQQKVLVSGLLVLTSTHQGKHQTFLQNVLVMSVPQCCLCTSRVGKNVADVNKKVIQKKEHRNLQAIGTAARMDCSGYQASYPGGHLGT